MTIALIICIVTIIALGFYLISVLSSIHELIRQVSYIDDNKTNMTINIGTATRSVKKLTDGINRLLVTMRTREIDTFRKDDEIKETITSMSHDIRTPLTSLKGYFDLMCESDNEADKDRYKKIISERIDSLSDMLEEMFLFTKINNAGYKLDMEKTGISEVFVSTLLSYYEDFETRGMTPDIEVDEDLYALADEAALKRVFQNLIKNSLTHGTNTFVAKLKKIENKKVKISIANDIVDGEHADVTKVFDRFYKGDKSRHVNSSGIGLSVTKKLVLLMGGSIEAVIVDNKFCINIYLELLNS